ncbi:unnamed protein product, partial [Urochloa humidicola]
LSPPLVPHWRCEEQRRGEVLRWRMAYNGGGRGLGESGSGRRGLGGSSSGGRGHGGSGEHGLGKSGSGGRGLGGSSSGGRGDDGFGARTTTMGWGLQSGRHPRARLTTSVGTMCLG